MLALFRSQVFEKNEAHSPFPYQRLPTDIAAILHLNTKPLNAQSLREALCFIKGHPADFPTQRAGSVLGSIDIKGRTQRAAILSAQFKYGQGPPLFSSHFKIQFLAREAEKALEYRLKHRENVNVH